MEKEESNELPVTVSISLKNFKKLVLACLIANQETGIISVLTFKYAGRKDYAMILLLRVEDSIVIFKSFDYEVKLRGYSNFYLWKGNGSDILDILDSYQEKGRSYGHLVLHSLLKDSACGLSSIEEVLNDLEDDSKEKLYEYVNCRNKVPKSRRKNYPSIKSWGKKATEKRSQKNPNQPAFWFWIKK